MSKVIITNSQQKKKKKKKEKESHKKIYVEKLQGDFSLSAQI